MTGEVINRIEDLITEIQKTRTYLDENKCTNTYYTLIKHISEMPDDTINKEIMTKIYQYSVQAHNSLRGIVNDMDKDDFKKEMVAYLSQENTGYYFELIQLYNKFCENLPAPKGSITQMNYSDKEFYKVRQNYEVLKSLGDQVLSLLQGKVDEIKQQATGSDNKSVIRKLLIDRDIDGVVKQLEGLEGKLVRIVYAANMKVDINRTISSKAQNLLYSVNKFASNLLDEMIGFLGVKVSENYIKQQREQFKINTRMDKYHFPLVTFLSYVEAFANIIKYSKIAITERGREVGAPFFKLADETITYLYYLSTSFNEDPLKFEDSRVSISKEYNAWLILDNFMLLRNEWVKYAKGKIFGVGEPQIASELRGLFQHLKSEFEAISYAIKK